jgi:beta-barrel assembly-enhancing protease
MQVSNHSSAVILVLAFATCLSADPTSTLAQSGKRSRSDRDISAIGHRKIAQDKNWYSMEKEKELGDKVSAEYERRVTMLDDPAIVDYVAGVTQKLAQNSDAKMPITVRVVDSDESSALTLAGGHQYITRGLLLRLESEGELASVLARGIAHTALRSATMELTRAALLQMASIPIIISGQVGTSNNPSAFAISFNLLKTRWEDELDADYFGVQYVYKSGYDPDCFARFVQEVWSSSPGTRSAPLTAAFDPFPPLLERLEALRKESANLSPKRDGAIVSTPEFDGLREHLRASKPEGSGGPKEPNARPVLLWGMLSNS